MGVLLSFWKFADDFFLETLKLKYNIMKIDPVVIPSKSTYQDIITSSSLPHLPMQLGQV